MKWNKVNNERNSNGYAFEAEEKDYIISAWEDRGWKKFHWEIRKKGTNFPVLYGQSIDIPSARSHASKAFKTFKQKK